MDKSILENMSKNINHNGNMNASQTDELQMHMNDGLSTSYTRLHSSSNCSSSSNETDLSFLLSERDISSHNYMSMHNTDTDELPAFEIRNLSPHGRTPSPIDNECANHHSRRATSPEHMMGEDYMTLVDLNAQISPPNDGAKTANSLETIFEGVYLHTPPKPERKSKIYDLQLKSKRIELLEKEAYRMLKLEGKENCAPKTSTTNNS